MDSEEYLTITNTYGEVKNYPISSDNQITRIESLLRLIENFISGVYFKKHKDGLISNKDYLKVIENFSYMDSIFTRIQIFRLLKNDFYSICLDVIADHKEYEGFPIPRANSLRLIS